MLWSLSQSASDRLRSSRLLTEIERSSSVLGNPIGRRDTAHGTVPVDSEPAHFRELYARMLNNVLAADRRPIWRKVGAPVACPVHLEI